MKETEELPTVGFATRLQEAMDATGKTRQAIAAETGFTDRALRYWCSGVKVPQIDTVAILARVLGVSPAWLAFGEGE